MSARSADVPATDPPHAGGQHARREPWATALIVLAAASCLASVALVAADVDSPVRAIAVLLLFVLAPGAAALGPRWAHPGLVVVTSLALGALAAQLLLWLGSWEPVTATYVLAGVCFPVLVIRLVRERRGEAPA